MAESTDIRTVAFQPTHDSMLNSASILSNCRRTLVAFLNTFDNPGGKPRGPGSPTDADQDLLRAMLVFAGAGLDAVLKQIIRDTLAVGLLKIEPLRKDFMDHFANRFIKKSTSGEAIDTHLIAQLLFSEAPREDMVELYSVSKTARSLQSKDELLKVTSSFGLEPKQVTADLKQVNEAFLARNQIVHEMDVNFQQNRSRRQRSRADIVLYVNSLLDVTDRILVGIEAKL